MAKTRYNTENEQLTTLLHARAEAVAGTFNTQNVANKLTQKDPYGEYDMPSSQVIKSYLALNPALFSKGTREREKKGRGKRRREAEAEGGGGREGGRGREKFY
jgi:hypothetical protein